ncbi:MAG TPA: single-stranded DNA-binding protein [Accumulibacter sp.]|nr:single-stranded DNA-binding protein [Accumulibacter sp.]HNK51491.1 single-stranded DNA-binding protein [Nitrospira sp.]HND81675.1 single-stranded DNA-binding protein [Accumulibacter sp.]HNH25181.1 single-stranded DNA-binding protein [Accumulibacter sp.]HNI74766.1 single-stranded DNA-binding protein [Accumulibacter sp.]
MWKVEVEEAPVRTKSGVSAKSGKPYCIREQECWIYAFDPQGKPHKHAQKVSIVLGDDQPPYSPGVYFVHPNSIYVDRWSQSAIKVSLMSMADFQVWFKAVFMPSFAAPSQPASVSRAA